MKTLFNSTELQKNNQKMLPMFKIVILMCVFLLFFTVENVYSQDTLRCDLSDT